MRDADGEDTAGATSGGRDPDVVAILVARSGGVAGITRRWHVQRPGDEAARWVVLLERCPWEEEPGADPSTKSANGGADRFMWRIEARLRQVHHEQVIPDEHLSGPWRDLVDAVRDADPGR